MPFGRNAIIRFEHGGTNSSFQYYTSVTYWYGIPSPSLGLLLRRALDYRYPNQRARVNVADVDVGKEDPVWHYVGVWYTAGSDTVVFSNPWGEMGETQQRVITSNRRLRDDEFMIPIELTEGRSEIRVRIEFTPVETLLFPGYPLSDPAWTEISIRHTAL